MQSTKWQPKQATNNDKGRLSQHHCQLEAIELLLVSKKQKTIAVAADGIKMVLVRKETMFQVLPMHGVHHERWNNDDKDNKRWNHHAQ